MGREFLDIFEEWAEEYDDSVLGMDPEYREVFQDYQVILDHVCTHVTGNVLEFGVGTGNLTNKLLAKGHHVIGIEPSVSMRKIAKVKVPDADIQDGDFLEFPLPEIPIHTITSTYAFHHLTDQEKETAIRQFTKFLTKGGKIVFADTMFISPRVKQRKILDAEEKGFNNLAADLQREYYPEIDTIERIFTENNFSISFQQMNEFTWLIIAKYK